MRPLEPALGALALVFGLAGCSGSEPPLEGVALQVPAEIVFDEVSAGATALAPLPIHNPSPTAIDITGVTLANDFTAAAYAFGIDLVPQRLAAGQTIIAKVTFLPRQALAEPVRSSFVIETDGRDAEVALRGRTLAPALRFAPDRLDFGVVPLGGSRARAVKVTNLLERPVILQVALDVRGAPVIDQLGGRGRFELTGGATGEGALLGGRALLAGESAELELVYHRTRDPAAPADRAIVTVAACDRPECAVSLPMSASAEASALACSPASIDFGAVRPGDARTVAIDCLNRAEGPILVTSTIPGGADEAFATPPSDPNALGPGELRRLEVSFSPPALGTSSSALELASAPVEEVAVYLPISVPLRGEASQASIHVEPLRIDFGRIALGTHGRRRAAVSNTGSSPLRIRVEATAPFTVEDAGPLTIAAGGSVELTLGFEPALGGVARAALAIESNDPD